MRWQACRIDGLHLGVNRIPLLLLMEAMCDTCHEFQSHIVEQAGSRKARMPPLAINSEARLAMLPASKHRRCAARHLEPPPCAPSDLHSTCWHQTPASSSAGVLLAGTCPARRDQRKTPRSLKGPPNNRQCGLQGALPDGGAAHRGGRRRQPVPDRGGRAARVGACRAAAGHAACAAKACGCDVCG